MTPDTNMALPEAPPPAEKAVAIIYHSETGHTRAIARNAAEKIGATLIEVRPQHHYCRIGKYLRGGFRAMTGMKDDIYPPEINISPFDIIIVGTPVWSQHPTPVITRAVAALQGTKEGCEAIIFTTCMTHAGRASAPLRKMFRQAGIPVQQSYVFPNRYPTGKCGAVLATGVKKLLAAQQ